MELRFSDRELTSWSGLSLLKRMLDAMQFTAAMDALPLPQPGSNRGYAPKDLLLQFMLSVWCGSNRFEHGEVTRFDPVLKELFGFQKMANFKAMMRLFRKFDLAQCQRVFDAWYGWFFEQLKISHCTLDLDSTVMTRYGDQQGCAKGYNPAKRGRASHHPLMAFMSETQMVANCWLRPGNSNSGNHAVSFLHDTLNKCGRNRVSLIRADSGFCNDTLLSEIEAQHGLSYVIAMPMHGPLQHALVNTKGWWKVPEKGAEGIEIARFSYQAKSWEAPRTVIGIRQRIDLRETARGKTLSLFSEDELQRKYRYGALVTNLTLSGLETWRIYRGRANCENRIKELKYDFGADSFCLRDFYATEAALNTVMMAHNVMSLFRQLLLKETPHATLKTLRYKLFAIPGYITQSGKKQFLNLALQMKKRSWFEGLWTQSNQVAFPADFEPKNSS
jgi:Transposase DDE domain group 1